jgi:mercuric ion binding protein
MPSKFRICLFSAALALALLLGGTETHAANSTVTLSNVHLCCNSCVEGVEDTVADIKGAGVVADKKTKSITISAPDKPTLQKAVNALVGAGFFGESGDPDIKVPVAETRDGMSRGLKLTDVHLCCNKCVKALNSAVATVKGVTGTTAAKDAKVIEIEGNFNPKDVIAALSRAGFAAQPQP